MEYFTAENIFSKLGKRVRAKRVIMVKTKSRYKSLPKGTRGKVMGIKVVELDGRPSYRVSIEWQTRSLPPLKGWFIEWRTRSSTPVISVWDEWQYDRFLEEV